MNAKEEGRESVLKINNVRFAYPTGEQEEGLLVIGKLTLSCESTTVTALLGPSGCGKTTLLNLIAGLLPPTAGEIEFPGGLDASLRRVGYVFQASSLIPWRNIRQNALFGAEVANRANEETRRRCGVLMESYGLAGFEDAFPSHLSGGMQQRVSIIRAVLSGAKVILLDEPFSNTDFQMRRGLQNELSRLVVEEQLIAVLVTHDIEDAVRIGDRIVVLSERPARIKAEIDIPISREERIRGGTAVMKEMASYVERVERIFDSNFDSAPTVQPDRRGI